MVVRVPGLIAECRGGMEVAEEVGQPERSHGRRAAGADGCPQLAEQFLLYGFSLSLRRELPGNLHLLWFASVRASQDVHRAARGPPRPDERLEYHVVGLRVQRHLEP